MRPVLIAAIRHGGIKGIAEFFDRAVSALEAMTPELSDDLVDEILGGVLFTQIVQMYDRGWQPRELAHIARHRLGRHEESFLMTGIAMHATCASHRDLAPAEWLAQLHDLAVPQKDSREAVQEWAAGWRAQAGLSTAAAWRPATQLVGLLGGLDEVPALLPLPCEWSEDVAVDPHPHFSDLTELTAALAEAEKGSDPREAWEATVTAHTVMAERAFHAAIADAKCAPLTAQVRSRRVLLDGPDAETKADLLRVICEHNAVRTASFVGLGISAIVGRPYDLDAAEAMYTSTVRQCETWAAASGDSFTAVAHEALERLDFMLEDRRESLEEAVFEANGRVATRLLAQRDAAASAVFEVLFPTACEQPWNGAA
ncbi:hypothetical protein [Tsukamurella sp. PLM1]|uniref:hypothetical protein n=1 Tax=Tsukamurella sp. PLM1 TaxID=2929795 RepID=UPI0020C10AF6|nr:hypothetical protein [Tsukamurella sp. PLM1]